MWERLRHIPPFIAAILGITASVIAAGTVVVNYFVRHNDFQKVTDSLRRDLNAAKCLSNTWYALLDSQLQQKISSDEAQNLTEVMLALRELKRDNVEVIIRTYDARVSTLSQVLATSRAKADELLKVLSDGTCAASEKSR
jgi:hypothetical protein